MPSTASPPRSAPAALPLRACPGLILSSFHVRLHRKQIEQILADLP